MARRRTLSQSGITRADAEMTRFDDLRRSEAEYTLKECQELLKNLGSKKKNGEDYRLDIVDTVNAYRRMAISYATLKDKEKETENWKQILRVLKDRADEVKSCSPPSVALLTRSMNDAYRFLAYDDFECFLTALELGQDLESRFFYTRRNIIREDVKELQRLEMGDYDMLGISAPPRTYKTALGTRFLAWVIGRHPEESCFFASHTLKMCRKVMNDILKIVNSEAYKQIFPGVEVESSSEDNWIDLYPKKFDNGYRTLYFAGIDSSMAGVINCSWLLYVDDLIASVMEASNPDRVANAVEKYTGDIRQRRANGHVRELMIATRFATNDPLAVMETSRENNPRCKFIKRPALNELGESNFMFTVNPMTTQHFMDIKANMSDVAFECVFQQNPIDREGMIFADLKRYKELPPGEPDLIYMACDVAYSGSDNLSAPVAYQYGDDVYIPDVVFRKEGFTVTVPLVASFIIKHQPNFGRFEENAGGEIYADKVKNAIMGEAGTRIYTERSKTNKMARIEQYEPIINSFYFLHRSLYKPGGEYDRFIRELERFNINGRNKHDDAADSLAMLAEMKQARNRGAGVAIIPRKGKRKVR